MPAFMRGRMGWVALLLALVCVGSWLSFAVKRPAEITEHTPLSQAVDVTALHENRTSYLGDNSRVIALLAAVHPEAVGSASLQLTTGARPYVVTIAFSSLAPNVTELEAGALLRPRAALLLATIDNADEVRWELPEAATAAGGASLTRAQADALTGSSVAQLGATTAGLNDLVTRLQG